MNIDVHLDEVSNDDLVNILKDDDYLDAFLEKMPQSIEAKRNLDELMKDIETLALQNLSKEKEIKDLKVIIIDRIKTLTERNESYKKLNRQHRKLSEVYSPAVIKMKLRSSAVQAERESDRIAARFLNGSIPLNTFLRLFTKSHRIGIFRRASEERL